MNPLLTCEEVLRFMPDYQESMLSPTRRLRFSLHLKVCPPCRAMLASLQAIPRIFQRAISDDAPAPSTEARSALDAVLARLQVGGRLTSRDIGTHVKRCSAHPMPSFVEQAVAAGTADRPLRVMAQAYGAIQLQGDTRMAEPFLPESVLKELPPREKWRWTSTLLRGCSSALLTKDPDTGASLHMILLPPGHRFPDHRHQADEHVLVLSGQVEDSQFYGVAGDWFHHEAGTLHGELQGRGNDVCWTLTRLEGAGVHLSGWRGNLQSMLERTS